VGLRTQSISWRNFVTSFWHSWSYNKSGCYLIVGQSKVGQRGPISMPVWKMLTTNAAVATDDGGMRYVLLALLLVAVVLLIIGAAIAVITWRNQRKGQEAGRLERENS